MPYIAPEVITEAKRMDLLTYLRTYEPGELVRYSGNTYCTREHDSLKISNGKWMWWSRGIGGKSALDYLIKVKGLDFVEAVETIMGQWAVSAPVYEKESRSYENQQLLLPQKSPSNDVVTQYLFSRGIDYEIINYCLDKELIIESLPYHNVVFIGYDEKKEAKYAAFRATNSSRIMGDCTGSKKQYSFRLTNEESIEVHLFECAIDLLSYATLAKMEGRDWHKLNLVSLHCHYVINSVSFKDGKRCQDTSWFKFRKVADRICEKYGLYYNPNPNRSKQSSYYYKQEQAGMPTRYSMVREAIDEAIAHSTNIRSLDYALTQMGYEHCLSESRKYWTIVPKGYTKPIRLKNLGEDYTEEAIRRRLVENQRVRIVPFAKQTVVIRQYRLPTRENKIKKVGGLYGLYLYYCYRLGYLPKYKKQNTARLNYLLKEDLLKLDKITAETRLLGRENISTDEQLFSYKESLKGQIKTLNDDRTHLRKKARTKMSDDELSKVKEQISTVTFRINKK